MAKIPIRQEDLETHIEEQLRFLELSATSFDNGFEAEAKRLAVTIRILVHDTNNSHSLLRQLNKKGVKFLDSTFDFNPADIIGHGGLVCVSYGPAGSKYVAMLDNLPPPAIKWVDFETWWNMPVLVDNKRRQLTRQKIILTAANQDGGAHIDPKLDEIYSDLAKKNSLGWVEQTEQGAKQIEGADRAAIRQIAHELLKTLKEGYSKKPTYDAGITIGGIGLTTVPPETNKLVAKKQKIGRNELCPCGSGKKFKHCHGRISA